MAYDLYQVIIHDNTYKTNRFKLPCGLFSAPNRCAPFLQPRSMLALPPCHVSPLTPMRAGIWRYPCVAPALPPPTPSSSAVAAQLHPSPLFALRHNLASYALFCDLVCVQAWSNSVACYCSFLKGGHNRL